MFLSRDALLEKRKQQASFTKRDKRDEMDEELKDSDMYGADDFQR